MNKVKQYLSCLKQYLSCIIGYFKNHPFFTGAVIFLGSLLVDIFIPLLISEWFEENYWKTPQTCWTTAR